MRSRAGWTGLLGFLYFTLSLRYAAPGITSGDSPELASACFHMGSAHAPGYPLYVLLGHLAQVIPVGTPAFRLSLLSVLVQTAAFLLLCTLLNRYLKSSFPGTETGRISIGAAFFLMISPLVHNQVTSPEVYSLGLFLTVFLALCLLEPNAINLKAASFLFGLALGHHHLILLLIPALLWAFRGFLGKPKQVISSFTLTLAGLSVYLVLPLRAVQKPFANWADPSTFSQFLFQVLRGQYGGNVRSGELKDGFADLGIYLKDLAFESWFIGLAGILFGLWVARRRLPVPLLLGFLSMLVGVPMLIRVPAVVENARIMESFFPPMLLLAAPFMALGFHAAIERLRGGGTRRVAFFFLLGLLAFRVIWAAPRTDASRNLSGEDLGRNILQCMSLGSVLYSEGDSATFPLAYLKGVKGLRPDAEVFDRTGGLFQDLYGLLRAERGGRGLPDRDLVLIERAHESRHPHPAVYYSEKETAPGRTLEYAGLLFRVTGEGDARETPRPAFPGWSHLRPVRVPPHADYLSREAGSRFHIMLGEYLAGRDEDGARRAFAEAARIGHDNARLFINIGVAQLIQGWNGEAAQSFEQATRLAPTMSLAWFNRAYAAERLGETREAILHYSEAIRRDPSSNAARNNLAYLHMKLGQVDPAVAQWEAVLRQDPGFLTAHRDLGLVLIKTRPEEARAHLRRYLQEAPSGPGSDYVRKVLAAEGG